MRFSMRDHRNTTPNSTSEVDSTTPPPTGDITKPSKANDLTATLKSTIKGIHGLGETLRGTLNQTVDAILHEPEGETKNRAIAEQGEKDFENMKKDWNKYESPSGANANAEGETETETTTGTAATTAAPAATATAAVDTPVKAT